MKIDKKKLMFGLVLPVMVLITASRFVWKKYEDWKIQGGSGENIKYSSLNQVDTTNVDQLKVAWVYRSENGDSTTFGPMQCNPVIVDNVLFGVSPRLKLFAIDAATGKEKWKFDPANPVHNRKWARSSVNMNRGVAYWAEGDDKRIIFTAGPIAFAVNAETGKLIPEFGEEGGVDLRKGLGRDETKMSISPTSPVKIYKDIFITSGLVSDVTPGHIRGFDVRTGKQKWIFHTIPYPGEKGYASWEDKTAYKRMGSTNAWSGCTVDDKRGLVFAGTGSPTNDFWGGERLGNGLFGNCIVALDAATGKLKWHFQTVHHDVWDMDISSPPVLVTIPKNGRNIDALVQTTKTGLVFVLDRETGNPVYPVRERPVPTQGAVSGEKLSPTQPFPVLPKPFVRQKMTEKDLNTLVSDSSYQDIRKRFRSYRSEGIYTPPTVKGTIILPGYDGGGEWGGPAVDPETNILYVNANEMAWVLNLVPQETNAKKALTNLTAGAILYKKNCMVCHGAERLGSGDNPSLIGVEKKYKFSQFSELLTTGRRMMPGFAHLSKADKQAIGAFVLNLKAEQERPYTGTSIKHENKSRPSYGSTGYNKFLTKEGYPAISPPWGTISAIDLNTGQYHWQVPFGEFEELKKKGIPTTGRENYGGPVVTAGGLIFIGATADGKFRAFSKKTGKILWETDLPAPGVATPSVYQVNGRQFIVIACGGSKWGGKRSDAYVAFALDGK